MGAVADIGVFERYFSSRGLAVAFPSMSSAAGGFFDKSPPQFRVIPDVIVAGETAHICWCYDTTVIDGEEFVKINKLDFLSMRKWAEMGEVWVMVYHCGARVVCGKRLQTVVAAIKFGYAHKSKTQANRYTEFVFPSSIFRKDGDNGVNSGVGYVD